MNYIRSNELEESASFFDHGDDVDDDKVTRMNSPAVLPQQRHMVSLTATYVAQRIGHDVLRSVHDMRLSRRVFKLLLLIQIVVILYYIYSEYGANDWEVENTDCDLPKLDPWDESIRDLLFNHSLELNCEQKQPELTAFRGDAQRIWFNDSELSSSNLTLTELRCMYRAFRISDNDCDALHYDDWARLENGTFIASAMIEIQCWENDTVIYENAHTQIVPVESEAEALKARAVKLRSERLAKSTNTTTKRSYKAAAYDGSAIKNGNEKASAERVVVESGNLIEEADEMKRIREEQEDEDAAEEMKLKEQEEEEEKAEEEKERFMRRPNVLLFIVDSMSRSGWIRELPQTLAVLKQTYESYIFDGMMKVQDNSYPNAIAFLTGYKRKELWSKYGRKYYDNWPLIFSDYHKQGYATLMAEDMVQHHLFAYDPRVNFLNNPFDHYYRPYLMRLASDSQLVKNSSWYCYGNNVLYKNQLEFVQSFFRKYLAGNTDAMWPSLDDKRRRPIFAINWLSELSHGTLNLVSTADKDFARFFTDAAPLIANDTFVFVLGDHGARYHTIRQTSLGRVEEQMPYFSMHAPRPLLDRYPQLAKTLSENARRLSTFWDVHVTLNDILDLGQRSGWRELVDNVKQPVMQRYGAKRGLSLLRPLPSKRGCKSAQIPVEYCVCEREMEMYVYGEVASAVGAALVRHVNALFADGRRNEGELCAELVLYNVTRAHFFKVRNKPSEINYRISVNVTPSGAILEGTLRPDSEDLAQYHVLGVVSRLNSYGFQSYCTPSTFLKKYCYCKIPLQT